MEGKTEDHGQEGRGIRDKGATLVNGNDNPAAAARRKTHGYELVLDPVVILDHLQDRLALEGGVGDVGELCRRVVAPDDHILDVLTRHSDTGCNLQSRVNLISSVILLFARSV